MVTEGCFNGVFPFLSAVHSVQDIHLSLKNALVIQTFLVVCCSFCLMPDKSIESTVVNCYHYIEVSI